jgi:hypothetical protein
VLRSARRYRRRERLSVRTDVVMRTHSGVGSGAGAEVECKDALGARLRFYSQIARPEPRVGTGRVGGGEACV